MMVSSCAIYHHYGPYYGKVIDADTKKPLEGAVILAVYTTWMYGSPGGPASYFLDTQEVVTDKNGEFRIPTFNAVAFRPLSTFSPQNPNVTIFKPHYRCRVYSFLEDEYEIVKLRELKTKEERLDNLTCTPTSVPNERMMQFRRSQDVERMDIGLKPGFLKEDPR